MQFAALISLASVLSLVVAAPAAAPETTASSHPHQIFKRKTCPSDFKWTGSCNGTSCRWGLTNYPCKFGSTGAGGGDGSCCGWNGGGREIVFCPNGGF